MSGSAIIEGIVGFVKSSACHSFSASRNNSSAIASEICIDAIMIFAVGFEPMLAGQINIRHVHKHSYIEMRLDWCNNPCTHTHTRPHMRAGMDS